MTTSWKVYLTNAITSIDGEDVRRTKKLIASCAYPEDVAAIVAGRDNVIVRKVSGSTTVLVWNGAKDEAGIPGGSFDDFADVVRFRLYSRLAAKFQGRALVNTYVAEVNFHAANLERAGIYFDERGRARKRFSLTDAELRDLGVSGG